MKVHKKVAGYAMTLGDLKEFITKSEDEGFGDDTKLNPKDKDANVPFGVYIFVQVSDGDEVVDSDFEGVCKECRKVVPATANGEALVHYRGETVHRDAQCYGVGKRVSGLVKK